MRTIMLMHKILQYSIAASLVILSCIDAKVVEKAFTLNQFFGKWYDIGRISKCEEIIKNSCNFYDVVPKDHNQEGPEFLQALVPIDNIDNCEYGLPIYTFFMRGTFVDSMINITGYKETPPLLASIKSYNNGQDLILTDMETDSCPEGTYRLWSRNRQASTETKAEFNKLAKNTTAIYYSWDRCPRLRTKTDNEFTLKQLEGKWYTIAKIYYSTLDKKTCIMNEVKVDYENQTFNYTIHVLMGGAPYKKSYTGTIFNSILKLKSRYYTDEEMDEFTPISCNNNKDLIIRVNDAPIYVLYSRRPKVSARMITEFKRVSKNFRDAHFTIYSQKNCQKLEKSIGAI